MTQLKLAAALVLSLSFPTIADEYQKNGSPQLLEKNYEAMHQIERAYEIGKSSLTLSVDCQESKEAAEKALAAKLSQVQSEVDAALTKLGLSEKNEKAGYDVTGEISSYASSPVNNQLDGDQKKYYWTNRCTGEKHDGPVRAKNVFQASKEITVWFPNQGTVLNDLSVLVTKVEALSDKAASGVKVVCNSSAGTNYDLDVTKATEKAAWEEVEKVAKERAQDKKDSDFTSTKYDNAWEGAASFQQSGRTRLPRPNVLKENGQWIAKFSDSRNYSIYYKQSSLPQSGAGELTGQKSYNVTAEATTQKGLYGRLDIVVSKACQETKPKSEEAVAGTGNEILAKLREINKGLNTETDRLDVHDAAGSQYSPLASYQQLDSEGREVTYFYNTCTLKKYEVTKQPKVTSWNGQQSLSITSSDLNALSDLRDSLEKKHAVTVEDPSQLSVSVGWSATANLATLEALGAQLEKDSFDKFLARGSEFQCDAGNFSFACLSSLPAGHQGGMLESADFGGAPAMAKAAYSEGALSDVSASERGVKTFTGKYSIRYTVRRVLVNNKR